MYHAGVWTNYVNYQPPDRSMATMAFDAGDGYVVLFGGVAYTASGRFSGTTNETWIFVSGHWTRLKLALEPPARFGAAMSYDAADGYVLMFGGGPSAYSGALLTDTWAFSAGKWSQVNVNSAPSGRAYAGMAYDAMDGYVVLFGGLGYNATNALVPLNDTWTYAGGTWTEIIPDDCYLVSSYSCPASPSERYDFGMTYDAADGVVLLFGGTGYLGDDGDTWAFTGGTWYNVTGYSTHSPGALQGAVMTYDAADGYVLLYGGSYASYNLATWSYSGFTWTLQHPAANPGPDLEGQMAYDGIDGVVVLEGGIATGNSDLPGNTWLY
jgi:hypothetical protein